MTDNEFRELVDSKFNNEVYYDGEYISPSLTPFLKFHCRNVEHTVPFMVSTEGIINKDYGKKLCPLCNGKFTNKPVDCIWIK